MKSINERVEELIEVLNLNPKKDGWYYTGWGKKTKVGLIETIKAILEIK